MAIVIDMTTGDVVEEKAARREAPRSMDTDVRHRPEMPSPGLQTYEVVVERRPAFPEELANVDIDAFVKEIEKRR